MGLERELELEVVVREHERTIGELRARVVILDGEAEMATRMLKASGAAQARLHQLLEEERLRNIELELRVARLNEQQPANHTCEARDGGIGETRRGS